MPLNTRPRGTNDIVPGEIELWSKLEEKIRAVCRAYGYKELRTPMFEHTELFQRGIGDTTDIVEKEMYTFLDRAQRSLTLRPEGTAPIGRAYLENKLGSGPLPAKVYYYGPMFRYERPQAGRYRQFTQFGVEALGSSDPLLDVEAIVLPIQLYQLCGLSGFRVELNSIGCPHCRAEYLKELLAYAKPLSSKLCKSCQSRLHRNPMRILDCKVESCRAVLQEAPVIADYLCADCASHFGKVQSYLDVLEITYEINPYLVRGFDYYTRTVFEVICPELGSQDAIGAGGRYDGLIEEIGGDPTPAVGFAVGVERLLLALKNQGKFAVEEDGPAAFVIHFGGKTKIKAAQLAFALREKGFWIELDYLDRSIRAQMKAANRLQAFYVLMLGEEELSKNQVLLRNMQSGEEASYSLEKLDQVMNVLGRV